MIWPHKADCSNKLYTGLDIRLDAKHGNLVMGTQRGILQQRHLACALLVEKIKTALR